MIKKQFLISIRKIITLFRNQKGQALTEYLIIISMIIGVFALLNLSGEILTKYIERILFLVSLPIP